MSPKAGLRAPNSGAAHVVLGEVAHEEHAGVPDAGWVPPQLDSDRARPQLPALGLGSVDGELLDLGPELLLTLSDILAWVLLLKPHATTLSMRRKPDVK